MAGFVAMLFYTRKAGKCASKLILAYKNNGVRVMEAMTPDGDDKTYSSSDER